VDSGDVVVDEIVALFQGEVDADAADHFAIVVATLEGARRSRRDESAFARGYGVTGDPARNSSSFWQRPAAIGPPGEVRCRGLFRSPPDRKPFRL
jgi:hypothetical protein